MIKISNQNNMTECDKLKSHISSKLHMISITPDNDRHHVTKTFTTLHRTTLKGKIEGLVYVKGR